MAIRQRPEKLGPQRRFLRVTAAKVDSEARTARISFSSEEPVDMWYGTEILSHEKGSMRNGERQQNMPLLFNHRIDDLLGCVETISIEDRRGYADIRFGKDERGDWAMQQYADGILRNSSFMYRVHEFLENVDDETVTATDWEPFEISLVTVPADPSVGAGRAEGGEELPVKFRSNKPAEPARRQHVSNATPGQGAPAGGAESAVTPPDLDAVRREAAREAQVQERQRFSEIQGIASRFGLGNEFVERHRSQGSSIDQVRADALDAVERQRRDQAGIEQRERERVAEIEATGARHQVPREMVRKWVDEKVSIENVRGLVLDYIGARTPSGQTAKPLSPAVVDWSQRESHAYSIRKAVAAAISGDWKEAGFEREVSNTIEKALGSKIERHGNGFLIPTNLPFQVPGAPRTRLITDRELMSRALSAGMSPEMAQRAIYQVGTAGQGGNIVGTELLAADFIEVLRNRTVTGQLGARFLTGLVENINIPRQNAQTSTYWVGESVALTESEATFDQVQLRPHVVGALSKMSRLALQQTTPAIEMIAREDLLMVMALAIDLAAINGTGASSQPTGIANTSGVGSVVGGTNGANLLFDHLIELYTAPLVANAPQENLGFAMNAKAKGYLATLKATTGQYLWQPQQSVAQAIPDSVVGYRYAVSNQLPYTLTKGTASGICSELMFGNWQELLIGEWGVLEIAVNPYDSTGFTTGDVLIRAFQTIDVGLRHPASFAVMSDALTPGF